LRAHEGGARTEDPTAEVAGQADDVAVAELGQVAFSTGGRVAGLHPTEVPGGDPHHGVQAHEVVPDGAILELAHLAGQLDQRLDPAGADAALGQRRHLVLEGPGGAVEVTGDGAGDRKSTRLNSSHVKISYAVFCLKKKK